MKSDTTSAKIAESHDMVKASAESIEDLKHDRAATSGDYAGAVAKTDPVEIKLVRKLDWRIMVRTIHFL